MHNFNLELLILLIFYVKIIFYYILVHILFFIKKISKHLNSLDIKFILIYLIFILQN